MVSFKGNTKELIAAAAKAKMLGTNLDQIKNSGMAMLDIESSLGKEMEARVLLGRDINLDAARAAALEGNIPKLQEEILKNAGSLKQFQDSGPLKQKALADAMNMSVEEMTKMLTSAEEMEKLGLNEQLQKDLANASAEKKAGIYETQAKMLEAQGDKEAANLARQKAAQEESASLSEKLGDIFAKLKQSAEKIITPLVDMVHAMFDAENGGAGLIDVFDGIMSAIKPVFTILMGVGKLIFKSFMFPLKLVFALIQPIIDAIQEVFSVMDAGEQSGGGLSAIFDGIGKVMDFIHGTVIEIGKGLVTMLITPAKLFWKAVISPIWDVFKGIGDTISKAFTPLQGATETGSKFGGIMDGIKSLFERFQPLITAVGKYFLSFILKPITLITEGISFIVKLFTGDFKGAAQSAGNILVEYFLGIPKKILGMVTGLIDGIFGTNLTGMLDKVFKWIKTTVGDVIFGVGSNIVDFIMAPFNVLKNLFGGIIKMFTGDFIGGLKQIGSAIIDQVVNVLFGFPKLVLKNWAAVIDAVFGTKLTEQVQGFFNGITSVFKDIGGFIMDIGASIFKFIMRPFDLAKGLINGIIQMFTGDFMGGLKTIGDAIMNFIMAPFNLVQELFNKFTGMFSGLGDKIKDAAKGMLDFLPDSLNPFAGGDEETAKAASAAGSEKKIGAAATGGTITKGGATLVGEKGPEVVSLPQGSVVANASATKQIGSAMSSMGGASPDGSSQSPELAVLQSMDAKIGSLLEPMQKVGEAIGSVVGSITSMASSLPGIGGVVSGISSFFGGGGDEKGASTTSVQTTSVPQMAAQPATGMQSVQSPGATPDAGKAGKQGPDVVAEKLDKLIGIMSSIASQPTIIKFGEKTVEEISSTINLRKTYNVAVDNTYGRRV
jgi:CMP-N-acetylneuraminic acid synthetase